MCHVLKPPSLARSVCSAAVLTLLHTLASHILVGTSLPLIVHHRLPDALDADDKSVAVANACRQLLALQWTVASVVAVFVVCQRRHLMVWAIFAPKLAFEVAFCVTTTAVVCATLAAVGGRGGRSSRSSRIE